MSKYCFCTYFLYSLAQYSCHKLSMELNIFQKHPFILAITDIVFVFLLASTTNPQPILINKEARQRVT